MNKVTLLVAELKKHLKLIAPVVNTTTVLPILEDLHIEVEEDRMKITASDLETVLTITLTVPRVKKAFNFCVNMRLFKALFDNCECEQVTLSYDYKERIDIVSEEPEFLVSLPTEDPANFPKTAVIEDKDFDFSIAAKTIIPYLKVADAFVSNDDLRPSRTGVYLSTHEGNLIIVATDAHRLYRKKLMKTSEINGRFKGGYIMPGKSCKVLSSLFKEGFTMRGDERHTECFDNTYRLIFRNIDARFPDWTVVWPHTSPYSFYAIRKKFIAAIKLAQPFSNKSTGQVNFKLTKDNMEVLCGDVDYSIEFKYKLAIYESVMQQAEAKFALNSKFVLAAAGITKDNNIRIRYESNTKAFIIDDDILIMPLMLNEYP